MQSIRTKSIGRRDLISGFSLAGMAIIAVACGDGRNQYSKFSSLAEGGDLEGLIASNHGHIALLTREQLIAGEAIELNIAGSASHPHTISLTAEQVAAINDGQKVIVNSTTVGNHQHKIEFN